MALSEAFCTANRVFDGFCRRTPVTDDRDAVVEDVLHEVFLEVWERAAEKYADASALSFFPSTSQYKNLRTWSYRELFAKVTQTANFFIV